MSRWYRVFGSADRQPEPAALVEHLRLHDSAATGDFRGDDQGWFAAKLHVNGRAIAVERYLAQEEDLRGELNAWAAWVEEAGHAEGARLMQHIITTTQLFTLQLEDRALSDQARALCCWLAGETEGIIHIDEEGLLTASGTTLVPDR